jgi:hypothetical protein
MLARMFTAKPEGGDAQRTMAGVWHVILDRLADTRPQGGCCGNRLGRPDGNSHDLPADAAGQPELSETRGRLQQGHSGR